MWEIWKSRKDELEAKKAEARKLYWIDLADKVTAQKPDEDSHSSSKKDVVVCIMKGLLMLLEENSFEELSRVIVSSPESVQTFIELQGHMNQLGSKMIRRDQEEADG